MSFMRIPSDSFGFMAMLEMSDLFKEPKIVSEKNQVAENRKRGNSAKENF